MVVKKNIGLFFALGMFLFAFLMFRQSFSYKYFTEFGPGPGLLPRWLSGGLIVLSLIYLFQSATRDVVLSSEVLPKGNVLKKVLSYPAAVVMFILIVSYTGFVIAGTAMLFMLLVKEFKWYQAMGISLSITVFLFFVFKTLLLVPLPVNLFGW